MNIIIRGEIEYLWASPLYLSALYCGYLTELPLTFSTLPLFSAHPQPTHFLYPTEPAALAYRPVTASQLALSNTRYGSNPGGYHLTVSISSNSPSVTGTLQLLPDITAHSIPYQYIPPPQTTSHHTSPPFFQPPSIQVDVPPIAQIQQTVNFDYEQLASRSVPAYLRERLCPQVFPQHQQQSW